MIEIFAVALFATLLFATTVFFAITVILLAIEVFDIVWLLNSKGSCLMKTTLTVDLEPLAFDFVFSTNCVSWVFPFIVVAAKAADDDDDDDDDDEDADDDDAVVDVDKDVDRLI